MSEGDILIAGGRVIDPATQTDGVLDLLVTDGRVSALFPPGELPISVDVPRYDATGFIVTPGFIDLHCHLRYPGQPDRETIASGTSSAVRGGFTSVCAMANTDPPLDSAETMAHALQAVRAEARCRVHLMGAVSLGLNGHENTDAKALRDAGAAGLSDDGNPVMSAGVMRGALLAGEKVGLAISAHEEQRDGSPAGAPNPRWPPAGEAAMVRRDIDLARATGGRLHIAHVSSAQSLELIAAAQAAGLPVTSEVTPHHLALSQDLWEGAEELPADHGMVKVNPPLRSSHDARALADALAGGTISAVATDHAPHRNQDKCHEPATAAFGFTGFELALPLLLSLGSDRLPLATMVERLTVGPARILGLAGGSLIPGQSADICVFDPNESWIVSRDTLISKGKNSPLRGSRMTGRVRATMVGGRLFEHAEDHGLRKVRAA